MTSERARHAHDALRQSLDERAGERRASLTQIRKAVGLTQEQMANTLRVDQGEISKIERRANMHLATLERFIEATGGHLRISALYDDVEVVLNVRDLIPDIAETAERSTRRATPPAKTRAKKAVSTKVGGAGSRVTKSANSSGAAGKRNVSTGRQVAASRSDVRRSKA